MLGVVIVTYNPTRNLEALVRVLGEADRVVVVDYHSGTDGRRWLDGLTGERLDRIDLDHNSGIAHALNLGLTRLLAAGCEWAVTLDQDSRLDSGYLRLAASLGAQAGPDVAMICPRIVEQGGHQVYQGCPHPEAGPCEIDFAITSGAVVRIREVLRLGGLDDDLFIDYVDFDLCLRLRAAGRRIQLHENLLLEHKIGTPLRRRFLGREIVSVNHSPIRRYYKHRNLPLLLAKHRNVPVRWALGKVGSHLVEPLKILLLEQDKLEKLRMVLFGFRDGIKRYASNFAQRRRMDTVDSGMTSVCVATYNGAKYLPIQLDSILKVLPKDGELILVDDCSTDGTREIIEDYSSRDKRLRYIYNSENIGPLRSFERAISSSRGKIIFLSDQDDMWHPEKIERMSAEFKIDGPSVVVSDAVVIDGSGGMIEVSFYKIRRSGPGFLKNYYKNTYLGCCMAFRADLKEVILPFPKYVAQHDEWIGLVGEVMTGVCFLPDKLISYRRHGANTSSLRRFPMRRVLRNRVAMAVALLLRSPKIVKFKKVGI